MGSHRFCLSVFLAFSIGLYLESPAYAIKPENVNDLAESIVQSMKDANKDPGFKRGVIQEIHPLMRVNASVLKGIRQFGLLNQHQTETSKGTLDPDYRSDVENQMQGLGHLGLSTANPTELYPKYGYMNYKTDGKERARQSSGATASRYGSIIFVFKQDDPKLLSRTTYSLRDSLGAIPVYPLNNLFPLEQYQKGIEAGGRYLELQYWGTLDLNDVQEIWLTESLSEENKKVLKEIAQTYGLPVYQTDENQGSDYEHLLLSRKREADLSGTVRSEARPFKQMSGAELIEHFKKVIEPDLSSSDASQKRQAMIEERIVTSLLAERGQVKDLPPKLEKEVQERIEGSRKNLMTLAMGNEVSPRVRASALHALLDETWPSPWLTQSEYKKIVPHLFDAQVLKELENRYYKTGPALVTALRKHVPDTEKGIDLAPIVTSYLPSSFSKIREAELRGTKTTDEFLKIARQPDSQSVKKIARDHAVAKTFDHWLSLHPDAAKTEMLIQDLLRKPDTLPMASSITGAASSSAAKFLKIVSPACSDNSPTQKKACQEILSGTVRYFLKLNPDFDEAFQLLQLVAPEEVLQDTVALPVMLYSSKLALWQGNLRQHEKIRDFYLELSDTRPTESHKKVELEFERSTLSDYISELTEGSKFYNTLQPNCSSSDLARKKICFDTLSSNLHHFLSLKPTTDSIGKLLRSIYSEESLQESVALPLISYAAKSGLAPGEIEEVLNLYDESKPPFTERYKKVKSELIQQVASPLASLLPKATLEEYSSIVKALCARPDSELKKHCLDSVPPTIHRFLGFGPTVQRTYELLKTIISEDSLQKTVALPLMEHLAKGICRLGNRGLPTLSEVMNLYDKSKFKQFSEGHQEAKDAFAYAFLKHFLEYPTSRPEVISVLSDLIQTKRGSTDPKHLDFLKRVLLSKTSYSATVIQELTSRADIASLEILKEAMNSGHISDPHPVLTTLSASSGNDAERVTKLLPFLDSKQDTVRKAAAEILTQAIARLAPDPGLPAQLEALRRVLGSQAVATIEKILKEKGFSATDAIDADKLLQGDSVTLLMQIIEELEAVKAAQPVAPESCPL